jgi:tetratricopeptide (TPR) repeat protein/predicted aspartyl protease
MGRRVAPVLAGLLALSAASQAVAAPAKCSLLKAADLPVTMVDQRPMLPVKINGADTQLMVDSGAFYSVISPAAATRLGMAEIFTPYGLTMKGVNGTTSAEVYVAKDFTLANIPFHKVQFVVGGREVAPEAAGVLGENVLGVMDVEYDLANGVIRLFKPENCGQANLAYWAGGKTVSMLAIEPARDPLHHFILGQASVNAQPIRVMFDTGAGRSVLKREAAERVGIPLQAQDVEAAGLSYGFGRRGLETWISPVSNFAIGGEQIQNTRLRVGNIDLDDADMLLGADFFLSHRVYVSNSQHRLYFTYNGGSVFRLERTPPRTEARADPPPAAAGAAKDGPAPGDAAGFARRGAAFASRRDFPAAVADFTRAIELEPSVAQHYYDRALARLNVRQPVLAMADLDQALKLKPDDPHGLELRGELYLSQGDLVRAGADFDEGLRAAPQDAELGLRVAGAYERNNRFEAAIARFDAWIAAHPRDERAAQALNGRCWARALWNRDLDKALVDCNAALKQGLSNSNFLDSRGLVHLRLGQFDAAIADYDAALKLQPKGAWSLYGRGLARRKTGATAEGDADVQAALAIQPNLTNAMKRYGLVEGKADEKAGADGT